MMKFKKGFAVAVAAGVLTTGGFGAQAFADTSTSPAKTAATAGTVKFDHLPDAARKGSLTIHKHDGTGANAGAAQNGLEQTTNNAFGNPVENAKFSIKKIDGIDLTTNAGWQKLAAAVGNNKDNAAEAVKSMTLVDVGPVDSSGAPTLLEKATNATGDVSFTDLPLGAYYVEETEVPADYVARTRPFIVTVPMTNPEDRNAWVYGLHVYAKNDPKDQEKTVQDSIAEIYGNKALYTIATKVKTAVKTPAEVEDYDQFVITDFFPEDRLEFAKATSQSDPTLVPVTGLADIPAEDVVVSIGDAKTAGTNGAANTYAGGEKLIKDTDWEFAPYDQGNPAGSPAVPASGSKLDEGRVVIRLKQAGLDKLNVAKYNGKYLTVKLKLQVKENAADQTSPIVNKFDVTNSRKKTPDTPPPTTPPTPPNTPPSSPPSYYGNVDIEKMKDDTHRLAGAEFDLYTCTPNYDVNPTPHTITGYTLTKGTDKKLNKTAIVADDTEKPDIKGLLANDWRDGKSTVTAEGEIPTAYCLVETKAPTETLTDGTVVTYELLAEPIGFQVKKDATTETISLQKTGKIINTKKNGGFELPLTGGKGVFALLLAGAAFLILGRGYSVYAGRRKDA